MIGSDVYGGWKATVEEVAYNVPANVMDGWRQGNGFGTEQSYNQEALAEDTDEVYRLAIKEATKGNTFRVTAGAPGAGKSTALEGEATGMAYICPDRVALANMNKTCAGLEGQERYTCGRAGSNFITHAVLARLLKEGYNIAFGSTSSSPYTGQQFAYLKKMGYQIELIHVSCPDAERVKAIKERDKAFVQTTDEDIVVKGELVPQRMQDYLDHATTIQFLWRKTWDAKAVLAANWSADKGLQVVDQLALEALQAYHNSKVKAESLKWDACFPNTTQ